MRKLSAWMRGYFAFSHVETRGALVLVLLTLGALSVTSFLSTRLARVDPPSTQDWRTLDSLVAVIDSINAAGAAYTRPPATLLAFDPNTADSATLVRVGLPPWIAQRIVKYRRKGGVFRVKADVKKIYGLSDADYRRLYPYLQLPVQRTPRKRTEKVVSQPQRTVASPAPKVAKVRTVSININTADTTLLKQLPGIGSKLSARIIKYRRLLGGYHRLEQLQEIYHMTDAGATSLLKNAYIADDNQVLRININQADAKILAQHPYISWDLARALVQHRQDYGEFRTLDDVREVYLMNEKAFEKIAPYLEI